MIFSSSALRAQSRCLICSARRFSAASRYSGATLAGSTSFCADAGETDGYRKQRSGNEMPHLETPSKKPTLTNGRAG
jgi:hypothetical protein